MNSKNRFFLDKKLIKFLLIFYFVAYVVDFIGSTLINYWSDTPRDEDLVKTLLIFLVYYIYKSIFLAVSFYITIPYSFKKKYFFHALIFHTLAAFLLSFYSSAMAMVFNKLIYQNTTPVTLESIWVRGLSTLSFNFFVYFAMVAIVYAYHYLKKQSDSELREQNLKAQLLDSKINALQSQLQPHFLFNTLNDISALMEINIEKSQNAIADLSDLLRDTLNLKDTKFLTLEEELNLLKKYLQIEKLRFGNKIHFEIDIDNRLFNLIIPPLILQPIVENSIKHGFSADHHHLRISLKVIKNEHCIVINVFNNGKSIPENLDIAYGTGITNILSRIDTIYNGDYHFGMVNTKNEQNQTGVLTTIKLPFH